jgi:hypothetical protein
MKSKLPAFLIFLTVLIFSGSMAPAQGKHEVSFGFGVPEFANIRYKIGGKFQAGICAGIVPGIFMPDGKVEDWMIAAEFYYHFQGERKPKELPVWYLSWGLGYYHVPWVNRYGSYDLGINPRIGRTINFSKKTGINLDLGFLLPVSAINDESFEFMPLLSGNISFFVRL